MADARPGIRVQVCYARPDQQILRELQVGAEATVQDAIRQSGVLEDMPEIDLATARVGIYGKLKTLDTGLREGDRVEIYHGLVADPKEARRRRARKDEIEKTR